MFQLLKLAVESISSRVNDGERLKTDDDDGLAYEERMLICKNNICVHVSSSCEHIPGYFSLKSVGKEGKISDLILYWVPNTLLAIGFDENEHSEMPDALTCTQNNKNNEEDDNIDQHDFHFDNTSAINPTDQDEERSFQSSQSSNDNKNNDKEDNVVQHDLHFDNTSAIKPTDQDEERSFQSSQSSNNNKNNEEEDNIVHHDFHLNNTSVIKPTDQDKERSFQSSQSSNKNKNDDEEDIVVQHDLHFDNTSAIKPIDQDEERSFQSSQSSNNNKNNEEEDNIVQHKFHFDNTSALSAIKPTDQDEGKSFQSSQSSNNSFSTPYGGVFTISLSEMKAVKIFYSDQQFVSGQLVVCNLENQYKVFHFHHGGIDNVAKIFAEWTGCKQDKSDSFSETMQIMFMIAKNEKQSKKLTTGSELHPEDVNLSPLDSDLWKSLLNPMGQIEDVNSFRKHVFFSGVSEDMRSVAWKFLLYYYPVQSTSFKRDKMKKYKEIEYQTIHEKRIGFKGEDYETFFKEIQLTVDKDVVRTDRSHPYFIGENNPNIEKMRNILLNYAVYNPKIGYTQGMSDLLSPVLAIIEDEIDAFWCFVGLMQFSLFTTTPKDYSMEKSLGFLRELLRVVYPEFYIHCLMKDEDLSLLFCHRWLVLCFKREFIESQVLQMWEACWSRYQTDYFHIFICVAILCLYGKKCIENKMRTDEMMQYFMDLAMKFDGCMVLKEARSLLFKFRKFQVIPCTLKDLLSGPGVWDGGIQPGIECVSRNRKCCFTN